MKVHFDLSKGAHVYNSLVDFHGQNELVVTLADSQHEVVKLKNVITFPGLTNSHDHLEFNSFPFLGNRIYKDYQDWGTDIHKQNKSEIERILEIPVTLRIKWGILKNLINGATTIVHHGGYHDLIKTFNYPVFLDYQYLHALGTASYWKFKLNIPSAKDIMIHIGEGVGKIPYHEINTLLHWNLWRRNVIGIHAIEMDAQQSKKFKAIVWCPDSNLRLYGKTAAVNDIRHTTSILFGTDSTVSASANMWEQLRVARSLNLLSDDELYTSLIHSPQKIFRTPFANAQIIARRKSDTAWNSFFEIDPEDLLLVVNQHKILLADQSCFTLDHNQYIRVKVGHSEKWIVSEFASVIASLEDLGVALPLNICSKKLTI